MGVELSHRGVNSVLNMTDLGPKTEGLTTFFQPILDLEEWKVCGVEALARLEDGGSAYPLIAQAQQDGWYDELELPLLEMAMRESESLPADLFCTLNISGTSVFSDRLEECLRAHTERRWGLEILENSERVWEIESFRQRIKELGCLLLIDDAGDGNSDEVRIRYMLPSIVKLDRLLLIRAQHSDTDRMRLESLISEARNSGAFLLAEGVETSCQLDFALELGCEYAQGFYFSEAVAAHNIPAKIQELEDRLWMDAQ